MTTLRDAATAVMLASLATVAACGGGGVSGDDVVDARVPDAAVDPDAAVPPDGPTTYAACREIDAPQLVSGLPLSVSGDLRGAGADLQAPPSCDVVDAPFGINSAGADLVIEVDGLVPETDYWVRLDSAQDLAFYVVDGCSTATGPSSGECQLFEDAATDRPEVGHFHTRPGQDHAYVVVDYFGAGEPADTTFSVQVYEQACTDATACSGTTPFCQDGRCAGCSSDFDCVDPAKPLCDEPTYTCVAGSSGCVGDDAHEDGNDGPAGAPLLAPGGSSGGAICDNPTTERDYFRFHVATPGDDWTIQLTWASSVDLDLYVYDATGQLIGMSLYEQPEQVALTYLPTGDYYAVVDYYSLYGGNSVATAYGISALRVPDSCIGPADCAAEYRNQLFRGDCVGGACQRLDGAGTAGLGDRCDSTSDCGAGMACPSFYFVADADTRMVCGNDCFSDFECAALGPDYVCTDYMLENFCIQKCTTDDQCPTAPDSAPFTPPWLRYRCQVSTGRCIAP